METTSFSAGTLTRHYSLSTGLLTSIDAPDVSVAFLYDGNLPTRATWSGAVAGAVATDYDNDLAVAAHTVNGGFFRALDYDDDGLLVDTGGLTITRDPANGLPTATAIGSVTTSTTFNDFAEPMTFSAAFGASALIDISYTRDRLGRITTKTETRGGVTTFSEYFYDDAGRLEEVLEDGVSVMSADFDDNGNRTAITDSFGSRTCTYDDQDRLVACGDVVYGFDDDGDLVSKTNMSTGAVTGYLYDSLGNLRRVDLPDGRVIEYVVDGLNRRVGKKVDGVLVKAWLYESQLRPIAELDGAGNVVSRFVYGERVNVPELVVQGSTTYRIVHDHLGSPLQVVNRASGALVAERAYDAWGNVLIDTNPGFIPFGFAGGLYDEDTALVRFGARDYDADVGRWTAKDPIRFAGGDTNNYAYAANNPVNFVDPTGDVVQGVVVVVIGGVAITLTDVAIVGILTCAAMPQQCAYLAERARQAAVAAANAAVAALPRPRGQSTGGQCTSAAVPSFRPDDCFQTVKRIVNQFCLDELGYNGLVEITLCDAVSSIAARAACAGRPFP